MIELRVWQLTAEECHTNLCASFMYCILMNFWTTSSTPLWGCFLMFFMTCTTLGMMLNAMIGNKVRWVQE